MRFSWRCVLVVVALMAASVLVLACEEEEEKGVTPEATPTPTVAETPEATPAATVSPTAAITPTPAPTPTPIPLTPEPPFVPGACDARSTPIDMNTSYDLQLQATTRSYPANCLYYCLWIPDGKSNLKIGIYDFDVDLDLYIGHGEFDTVMGLKIEYNVSYIWKSNEFGTGDEDVNIRNPEGGVYYTEVCAYEGEGSSFQLQTTLQ